MTTRLTKPVKRLSNELYRDKSKYRNIIVCIYPAGFIGLRLQGTRREETIPLSSVYERAIKTRVAYEHMLKIKERKEKRKNKW